MRCPLRFRGSALIASGLFLASLILSACASGEDAEPGAVGTTAAGPLAIRVSSTYVTLENRAGLPIVDARVEIIPRGVSTPFRTMVGRVESSSKREVPFSQFRSSDGTPFRRGAFRAKSLKVTAKDITGKPVAQEIPFE